MSILSKNIEERNGSPLADLADVAFVLFDKDTVEPWISQVNEFIETISRMALTSEKLGTGGGGKVINYI